MRATLGLLPERETKESVGWWPRALPTWDQAGQQVARAATRPDGSRSEALAGMS